MNVPTPEQMELPKFYFLTAQFFSKVQITTTYYRYLFAI